MIRHIGVYGVYALSKQFVVTVVFLHHTSHSFVYIVTPFLLVLHSFVVLMEFSSHLLKISVNVSVNYSRLFCTFWDALCELRSITLIVCVCKLEKDDIGHSEFSSFLWGGLGWDGASCDLWWMSTRAHSLQQL